MGGGSWKVVAENLTAANQSTPIMSWTDWQKAKELCLVIIDESYGNGWRVTRSWTFTHYREIEDRIESQGGTTANTKQRIIMNQISDTYYATLLLKANTGVYLWNYDTPSVSTVDHKRVNIYWR